MTHLPFSRDAAVMAAFDATWPATETRRAGGFRVSHGAGGGGRVSTARAVADWWPQDIATAAAQQDAWGQPRMFAVADDDAALAAALSAAGYRAGQPTTILAAPIAGLADVQIPPLTAFDLWPPLAIQREIWAETGIGAPRQAIMDRAAGPKTALLGRLGDRAAGAGFAAVHGTVGMIHALSVRPEARKAGLGGWMVRRAAGFALRHGADRLALAVTRANAPALALYRRLGFTEIGGYRYFTQSD